MQRLRTLFALTAGSLALAACTAGPDYARPEVAPRAEQVFLGGASPAVTAHEPQGDWWRLYQDPVLDGLVAEALTANTDLRVALANVEKARALLRESRSDLLPQTSIDAGATYGRVAEGQRPAGAKREAWQFDAGLSVAYELDLAGRVRRSIEASRADTAAAEAAADAVRVAVVAETTRAYADASSAAARIAVAERTLELLDKTATLTAKRFEAGRTSRLDVARVEALRGQQRATISVLRAQRAAALFRLAFLTGRVPADLPPAVGQRAATRWHRYLHSHRIQRGRNMQREQVNCSERRPY